MSNCKSNNDGCTTGLALIFLGIIATPLTGLYLWLWGKTEQDKSLGAGLTFISFIIWGIFTVADGRT